MSASTKPSLWNLKLQTYSGLRSTPCSCLGTMPTGSTPKLGERNWFVQRFMLALERELRVLRVKMPSLPNVFREFYHLVCSQVWPSASTSFYKTGPWQTKRFLSSATPRASCTYFCLFWKVEPKFAYKKDICPHLVRILYLLVFPALMVLAYPRHQQSPASTSVQGFLGNVYQRESFLQTRKQDLNGAGAEAHALQLSSMDELRAEHPV